MLEVRSPGALTTVQDGSGRPETAHLGVPRGGAADPVGLAVANLLLANHRADAALEITLGGAEIIVTAAGTIALGGADLGATATLGRRTVAIAPGTAARIERGTVLAFRGGVADAGIRTYLAVPGGIDVPVVLGSRSTCLPGRFGGFDGRPLEAGDRLSARGPVLLRPEASWPDPIDRGLAAPALRIVRGPHATPELLDALVATTWDVSATSSRAGVRLGGASIDGGRGDLASLPMTWGAIQVPPGGEPIVLLVDAPTVGGYPVIAVVATVDRPRLGQLRPGAHVRFEVVSQAEARAAELDQRRRFAESATRIVRASAWDDLDRDAGAWPGEGGVDARSAT